MKASDAETLRLTQGAMQAFAAGDLASARANADAALARSPEEPNALQVLGLVALRAGNASEARTWLERADRAAPGQPAILNALGGALKQLGDLNAARDAFTRAGEKGHAEAWRNLGNLESAVGQIDEALAAYGRALALRETDALSHANIARLIERRGDLAAARRHGERALALDPRNDVARIALAQAAARERAYAKIEPLLAPVIASSPSKTNRALAFGLIGEAHDKSGAPRAAFAAFRAANTLLDELYGAARDDTRSPFHPSAIARMNALAQSDWPKAGEIGERAPVFLVGFPRSGTTLLDQILSGHPDIGAMEEKEAFAAAIASGDADAARVRETYWAHVANEPGAARPIFVDKLPLNLVLWPLIRRAFPSAKIILALRDPRDVILSAYQQRFGMNVAMAHLLRLDTAAAYYAAAMSLGMACWEREPERVCAVRYEDVVRDLEGEARRLTNFLGVPFDPAMLAFQRTAAARDVNTPSLRQVSQPLYTSSVGRWRAYAEDLAPALPVLAPWVQRLGYAP